MGSPVVLVTFPVIFPWLKASEQVKQSANTVSTEGMSLFMLKDG